MLRRRLNRAATIAEVDDCLTELDPHEPFPPSAMRVPRGKTGGTQRVALPPGYLDELDDATPPTEDAAETMSGG